jgi:hypothetical protein
VSINPAHRNTATPLNAQFGLAVAARDEWLQSPVEGKILNDYLKKHNQVFIFIDMVLTLCPKNMILVVCLSADRLDILFRLMEVDAMEGNKLYTPMMRKAVTEARAQIDDEKKPWAVMVERMPFLIPEGSKILHLMRIKTMLANASDEERPLMAQAFGNAVRQLTLVVNNFISGAPQCSAVMLLDKTTELLQHPFIVMTRDQLMNVFNRPLNEFQKKASVALAYQQVISRLSPDGKLVPDTEMPVPLAPPAEEGVAAAAALP